MSSEDDAIPAHPREPSGDTQRERRFVIGDTDFRTVAEDAPVMLWVTNADGNVVFTNSKWKKFIGAAPSDQVSGDAWVQALHPDDVQLCLATYQEAFIAHKSFQMEYRLRRADGQYRYVLDVGEPYISHEGKFSGYIGSSSDITERKNHEDQLRLSQLELSQHNQEMQLINQLNSYLQVCRSLEETYPIIAHYARRIFADDSGALYLFDEGHNLVDVVAAWGDEDLFLRAEIAPDDCWALRQGRLHAVDADAKAIVCGHLKGPAGLGYVCAPAVAQGEMIGVLCVVFGPGAGSAPDGGELPRRSSESRVRLVSMAADNLAMALVSLKLREALRRQSVRDPLTRLFNRRYLEETMLRELSTCKRGDRQLGLVMIDIDHFKEYNDKHGHDAGDFVLVEMADIVRGKLRSMDIPCRYGGEELVLVMPGASKEIATARAEAIRQAVEQHAFVFRGAALPQVTVSLGVAAHPADGDGAAELLKAADSALYEAKKAGRNRVVVAGAEE